MLHIMMTLEDTLFEAERVHDPESQDPPVWKGRAFDSFSGKEHSFALPDHVIAALSYLALGGENSGLNSEMVLRAYETVEPFLAGWPKECRPIP